MKKTTSHFLNRILLGLLLWTLLLGRALLFDKLSGEMPESTPEEENGTGLSTEKAEEGSRPDPANMLQSDEIRVVLMDTDFQDYYHPSVTVSCRGETITLRPDSPQLKQGSFTLQTQDAGFTISSIKRSCGIPKYRGDLTIYAEEKGLLLVNSLPLEEYLCAVLPSEMPASSEKEALKAQAICARTYAKKQMQKHRMERYHADVDDSVACQVYGNLAWEKASDQAVSETDGRVLTQEGELIEAYYFSTSSGRTSTNEIWDGERPLPYLQSVPCPYDADSPWSSWETVLSWESLETHILEKMDLKEVVWQETETAIQEKELQNLRLADIKVSKKNPGGAVTELTVLMRAERSNSGEEEDAASGQAEDNPLHVLQGMGKVRGEYHVRELLSPANGTVRKADGDTVPTGALLPSAYLSLVTEPGKQVLVQGSGYGHGVGMSQSAAEEMAKEGFSCEEILHYFFKDVRIAPLAE